MSQASQHFTSEAQGVPTAAGRFVSLSDVSTAEFLPGLTFRPVLGESMLANFVHFEPDTEAPLHVHEEEQVVVVLDGSFEFEIDGEVRKMTKGDLAIVPPWVLHRAKTDSQTTCDEVDFFSPPRKTLLDLANSQVLTEEA